jgi:hypothetical protein
VISGVCPGGIWCPLKGLECCELGENRFLFTFHQPSGKNKALEDGPWMLADEILEMVDLDESKPLDELELNCVPIWVRISQIPIGMMNKTMSEVLSNAIGEFIEADIGPGGKTVGPFLRVKVKLDIHKPLMRGLTLLVGKDGSEME